MAGAGYLHSYPVSAKNNPSSVFNKSFSASLIKYPASISAQSAGFQFPFKNGVVRLRLRSDRKLQLKSNPKYQAIRYEGMHEEVKKNVVLVADCSSSPRIKGIFKSMNEKFKNK